MNMIRGMKVKKRVTLAICTGTLLCIFVMTKSNDLIERLAPFLFITSSDEDISCYVEPPTMTAGAPLEGHQLMTGLDIDGKEPPIGANNIFFHETSCFGDDGIVLTARQACAVESAAKMNPTMKIYIFFLSQANYSRMTQETLNILSKYYNNISIRRILMKEYVKNTPLNEWWDSGIFKTSRWPKSHISDILRYLTLWKFGGIYLDLDVVVTSSLEKMTNFAGAEDWEDVAAGVLGFSSTGLGKRLASACLRDLKKNFRGDVWGNNGPGVITRTLQKLCATKYAQDMTSRRCRGFTVYPPSAFYPIHYKKWHLYFDEKDKNSTMSMIDKALAIHVWNKLSSSKIIPVGSQVPYALVAHKYCPQIYTLFQNF